MDIQRSVSIYTNASKAISELHKLESALKANEKQMATLDTTSDSYSKELKELMIANQKLRGEITNQNKTLNINSLTLKQLAERRANLKAVMRNSAPDSQEWIRLNDELRKVNIRHGELSNSVNKSDCAISTMAKNINKYIGSVSAFLVAGNVLVTKIASLTNEYLKLDDALLSVRKRTGQTDEQVQELNQSLNSIQTRTAKEDLLKLSEIAGKLGITNTEDIFTFTKAADKLNLVFSELGTQGVEDIANISEAFGLTTDLGIEEAFDRIGSAISDVDDKTMASAPNIIEFSKKMAGVAKTAGIGISDIIGYGVALESNGHVLGTSAQVLQKFILTLYNDPAKFAKIAGKDVNEFTSMLGEDANGAIKLLLKNLNGKDGLQQLAPIFKEMGVDGARAGGIFSTLAEKIDMVESAQVMANDAFVAGIALTDEYNMSNDNASARAVIRQKQLQILREELGKKLIPVLEASQNMLILLGRTSMALGNILLNNKGTILTLAGAWLIYLGYKQKDYLLDLKKNTLSKLKVLWLSA